MTTSEPEMTATLRLARRDSGGDGTPVVLLHGLAGDSSEWRAVTEALGPAWRAIAVDQRGHGRSELLPADVSREAFVADIAAVIRAIGQPVVLVGQSLGGNAALLVAAAHPDLVSALVLVEAGPDRPAQDTPDIIAGWLDSWPLPFPDREAAATFFGGGPAGDGWAATLTADPQEVIPAAEVDGGLWPRFDRDTIVAVISAAAERSYWDEWRQVRCPAHVVRGESGFVRDEEATRMRDLRPDIPITVIPGVGHDLHLEAPEELAALIADCARPARP